MSLPAMQYLMTNRRPTAGEPDGFDDALCEGAVLSGFATAALGEADFGLVDQEAFTTAILADLSATAVQGVASLCLFIHGFDTTWDGIQGTANSLFGGLREHGNYAGVQLAFDWPSGHDALDFYGAESRAKTTGEVTFPLLVAWLQSLQAGLPAGTSLELQVLCHSMGNYTFYRGASAFHAFPIAQTLNVAAMLDYSTYDLDGTPLTPGATMSAVSDAVSVYYTRHDDVLGWAPDGWLHELGKSGPSSFASLYANVVGVDCSAVCNATNVKTYGASEVHTSYFSIPETLADMASALMGGQSGLRQRMSGTNQGFVLPDKPSATSG